MEGLKNHFREHTNPWVFFPSAVIIVGLLIWGVLAPSVLNTAFTAVRSAFTTYAGWWFILSVSAMVVFVLVIALSPWGKIRLGPDDSRPEFSTFAWFSMLFTAGMGIGLVFYGASEPVTHFLNPPTGKGGTEAAATTSMNYTLFHWGIHPWAIYATLGLALGYFAFRRGLPMRPASALYPLIGNRIYGPIGHLIDILAVFGTLFGLATSLGLGAQQISSGLSLLLGIGEGGELGGNAWILPVLVIAALSGVAITSVMLGVDKGIRRLSVSNMYLAIILMAVVFFVAAPLFILDFTMGSVGNYIQNLPETSLQMFTFSKNGSDFIDAWTVFYWSWWLSWSPFVGMFIARISRGRTIRQFILGSVLAPTAASSVWFVTFGGNALNILLDNPNSPLADITNTNGMFVYLNQLPWSGVLATVFGVLAIIVVALFFATSSDSGSLVVDILTNGGDPNPDWKQRLFWAFTEGAVGAILLVAGAISGSSALGALQAAAVAAGLPFSIVLVFVAIGTVKALSQDRVTLPEPGPEPEPGRAASRPRGAPTPQQYRATERQENEQ